MRLTVIGVLDVLAEDFGDRSFGMFSGRGYLDSAIPFPVPITHYRLQVTKGVDTAALSDSLEVAFRDNGLEADVLADVVAEHSAAQRAFNYLFTGFMALGLLVGIASLGVVSLRAVVERRQQIGVLRAIGYSSSHGAAQLPHGVVLRGTAGHSNRSGLGQHHLLEYCE